MSTVRVRPGATERMAAARRTTRKDPSAVRQTAQAGRRAIEAGSPPARDGDRVAEMQRRRLIAATVEVAGDDGVREASVATICHRAGVSRRTFYELFDDREACLLAAVEDAARRVGAEIVPVYGRAGSWRERVRAALNTLLERFDAEPALARLCVVETLRAGPAVLERRARALAALADAVEGGRAEATSTVPPLTAQGAVGGALAVVHARLLESPDAPLVELTGALAAMIVHPYLGPASAEEELAKPAVKTAAVALEQAPKDPFKGLSIRFTYRTARVLATIAAEPGASNREISDGAGITDEGQTSRLLARLNRAGLIANRRDPAAKGEANAWSLTDRGQAIQATLAG